MNLLYNLDLALLIDHHSIEFIGRLKHSDVCTYMKTAVMKIITQILLVAITLVYLNRLTIARILVKKNKIILKIIPGSLPLDPLMVGFNVSFFIHKYSLI